MSDAFVPGLRYPSDAHQLWALLVEVLPLWEERMAEVSGSVGLSPVQTWALIQLNPDRPLSQKELAERLHCTPSTVVDPADRLEERGLVVRQTHARDRRIKELVVTPAGRALREELIQRLFEPPVMLDRLPAERRSVLRDTLLDALSQRNS